MNDHFFDIFVPRRKQVNGRTVFHFFFSLFLFFSPSSFFLSFFPPHLLDIYTFICPLVFLITYQSISIDMFDLTGYISIIQSIELSS